MNPGIKATVRIIGPQLELVDQGVHSLPAGEDITIEVRLAHDRAPGKMILICEVRPASYRPDGSGPAAQAGEALARVDAALADLARTSAADGAPTPDAGAKP